MAVESYEFPDVSNIEARMLPFCYEAGLSNGHSSDASQYMSIATETFIKEVMTVVFGKTRSNGPGESGNAGFGPGNGWVQTHKYRKQLAKEEGAAQRGELTRDKCGLLPIEARAASERGPLGMADLRIALEMGDCGMGNFPGITKSVTYDYREGELENWEDYTWVDDDDRLLTPKREGEDIEMGGVNGNNAKLGHLTNGVEHVDVMDIDNDYYWDGAEDGDGDLLDGVLDSCLTVG